MLTSYRRILAEPGALLFSATGLVARLPISMVILGIVLLVSSATGSYALAGSVSATYLLGNGAFAIVQGRMLDRLGQSRVLPSVITVFGVAMALLVWSIQAGWPVGTAYLFAAVSGAALPSVGSCVRARWSYLLRDKDGLQTAFALEGVADEAVFILGPILVTALATAWHPVAGLTSAIVTGLLGTLFFAAQRSTEPPVQPHDPSAGRPARLPFATMVPLAFACAALGSLFGSVEVTVVAFSDELGSKGAAGGLLAVWALGSLLAAVITGAVPWRRGPLSRLRWGAAAMMTVMLPLGLIGSLWVMAAALFVAGFAIAPTLIAAMSLTQRVVPASRLTEGMAVLHTGLVAGVAPGATLAGVVIDAYGASTAFLVSVGAGVIAALSAQVIPRGSPTGPVPESESVPADAAAPTLHP